VAGLAGRQHGVVSTAQLLEVGLTRPGISRRVRAKRLYPLHRGVYAVGHVALTWRSQLIAAVYACGCEAVASYRAAGALHGLVSSGRIEVTGPRGAKPKPGITVHRARTLPAEERTTVDGISTTTSPARWSTSPTCSPRSGWRRPCGRPSC
jgi:predicted transcriptional regulator of viral defense system